MYDDILKPELKKCMIHEGELWKNCPNYCANMNQYKMPFEHGLQYVCAHLKVFKWDEWVSRPEEKICYV